MVHAHIEAEASGDLGGKSSGSGTKSMSDNWFLKIEDYITGGISRFVAFLFFLITVGAILGYIVAQRGEGEYLILVPAAAGLVAYYNRDFALAVLVLVGIIILL